VLKHHANPARRLCEGGWLGHQLHPLLKKTTRQRRIFRVARHQENWQARIFKPYRISQPSLMQAGQPDITD
jgi:hypothetical protein